MQQPARFMHHGRDLPDRLHHPGLVVGRHDRDQRRWRALPFALGQPPLQGGKIDDAVRSYAEFVNPGRRKTAAAAHRRVLDCRDQQALAAARLVLGGFKGRRQRQHVGFGRAGGEHDVAGLRSDQRRHPFAGLLDQVPDGASLAMDR